MTDILLITALVTHVLVVAAIWDWMEEQNDNDRWE